MSGIIDGPEAFMGYHIEDRNRGVPNAEDHNRGAPRFTTAVTDDGTIIITGLFHAADEQRTVGVAAVRRFDDAFGAAVRTHFPLATSFESTQPSASHQAFRVAEAGQWVLGNRNVNHREAESRLLAAELEAWKTDPAFVGNKELAAQRIQAAFDSRMSMLFNPQTFALHLEDLELNSLPACIARLSSLTELYLGHNRFDTFPEHICQLRRLRTLDLCNNTLSSLPEHIGQLHELRHLELSNNALTSFPAAVLLLRNLDCLQLRNNGLELLPVEIGQLTRLRRLELDDNPNLRELPLSLGQTLLGVLTTQRTEIPEQVCAAILEQCRGPSLTTFMQQFDAVSFLGGTFGADPMPSANPLPSATLSQRLVMWKAAGKSEVDLSGIEQLTDPQKMQINDWLKRLEGTRDFGRSQERLAKTACEMLRDVVMNEVFKELFFAQVISNLERCEDRSAMAFNEIFTAWKIASLDDTASIDVKLQLITQAAKTLALRAAISSHIAEHEKANNNIEQESVEIYLFYETALRGELHLLSAIENMRYGTIGERRWISERDLVHEVNTTYRDYLIQLPVFQKILESDPIYQDELKTKLAPFEERMEVLSEQPGAYADPYSSEHLEWQTEMNLLAQSHRDAKAGLDKEWLKRLSDQPR